MTNTSRTLKALHQDGYICGIVERFNRFGGSHGIRQDLFGFIDIIAIKPNEIYGIQSCGQAFSEHNKKILNSELAIDWINAGGKIELWGWRKIKKKKGGKQMIWKPRIKVYTIGDFTWEK